VIITVSVISLSACGNRSIKSGIPNSSINNTSVLNSNNENLGKYPLNKSNDTQIVDSPGGKMSTKSGTPSGLIDKNTSASNINIENLGEYSSHKNNDRLLVNSFEGKYIYDIYTNEDQFGSIPEEKNEFPILEFVTEEFTDNKNATIKIQSDEYANCFYIINKSPNGVKIKYYKIESKQEIILYENEFTKVND
jgi:hypothetical protein